MFTSGILILSLFAFVLACGGLALICLLYRELRRREQLKLEQRQQREAACLRVSAFLTAEFAHLQEAVNQFSQYINSGSAYFSNYKLAAWKSRYSGIYDEIRGQNLRKLNLGSEIAYAVSTFESCFRDADSIRAEFNRTFIGGELERYREFFDKCIEDKSLDIQQRTAVVTDEDNNLVIAGAGTGKTTTMLGKVYYVVNRYGVAPDEILLISFTNKSASDLAKRIKIPGAIV